MSLLFLRTTTALLRSSQRQHFAGIVVVPVQRSFSSKSSDDGKDLTRKQFAAIIAKQTDLSKSKADAIIKTLFDTIAEKVAEGKSVKIPNFGKFYSVHISERMGYNPSTREPMQITSRQRPRFRPFQAFKELVNKDKED
mmetsp:Transcript_31974/g.35428  ORF Transcript_31974/g.35428 Transcript_31974/m.35428 type:complete len:139 (+) Transcript_31974:143-559(+)